MSHNRRLEFLTSGPALEADFRIYAGRWVLNFPPGSAHPPTLSLCKAHTSHAIGLADRSQ